MLPLVAADGEATNPADGGAPDAGAPKRVPGAVQGKR